MGKKRGLSVTKRVKIVTLNKEEYSERKISKKLKFNKTAIHQATEIWGAQDLHRSGKPRVTFQKDNNLSKRMVVRSPTS